MLEIQGCSDGVSIRKRLARNEVSQEGELRAGSPWPQAPSALPERARWEPYPVGAGKVAPWEDPLRGDQVLPA